jgi:NDP-sugar pyrophosphorylase family protein
VAQSVARDVLRDAWIALVDAGYDVNWTVYDEFVVPVPEDADLEAARADVRRLMVSSSPWAEGLPLDAEIEIADHYKK